MRKKKKNKIFMKNNFDIIIIFFQYIKYFVFIKLS